MLRPEVGIARLFDVPHDVWGYVPRLHCPALVIYGTQSDTFLPHAVKRFHRDAPRAIIRPVDDAGHLVPMERPAECAGPSPIFCVRAGCVKEDVDFIGHPIS